jgi:hypothetical protein
MKFRVLHNPKTKTYFVQKLFLFWWCDEVNEDNHLVSFDKLNDAIDYCQTESTSESFEVWRS